MRPEPEFNMKSEMEKSGETSVVVRSRLLLHVGCGIDNPARLPDYFREGGWAEIRLDVDPLVKPDIVASITDLSIMASASVDAVWSSHNLEHLHGFEVPQALAELRRVLKPDGFFLVTLPNLEAIARYLMAGALTDVLYESAAGPITALDVIYGHQASLRAGNAHMAHRTAFTSSTLGQALLDAGFDSVRVHEGSRWDLWALATMPETPESIFASLGDVAE